MNSISYMAVRTNLSKTMEQVCERKEPVIITRRGKEPVVMISLAEFRSLEETAYLLSSRKNAQRLIEAIADLERTLY